MLEVNLLFGGARGGGNHWHDWYLAPSGGRLVPGSNGGILYFFI